MEWGGQAEALPKGQSPPRGSGGMLPRDILDFYIAGDPQSGEKSYQVGYMTIETPYTL